MIIYKHQLKRDKGRVSITFRLEWEDTDRTPLEVYYEVQEKHEHFLNNSGDAILVASVLPAFECKERRIHIEDEISPYLLDGFNMLFSWMQKWFYYDDRKPPILECSVKETESAMNPSCAVFLSGGIDSLSLLTQNIKEFPPSHPGRIKYGIIVYGFDFGGFLQGFERVEEYKKAYRALEDIASDAGIELIEIRTNVKHIYEEGLFWMQKFFGAALCSMGHSLSNGIGTFFIGSSFDVKTIKPWGDHPLIISLMHGWRTRFKYSGGELTRFEKTRIVSDSPIALQNIRVCVPSKNALNCGKCEKCVRTMLALQVLGVLNQTSAFEADRVTPSMINRIRFGNLHAKNEYELLIPDLLKSGHHDLVYAIRKNISWYKRYQAKRRVIERLKYLDYKITGGKIRQWKNIY